MESWHGTYNGYRNHKCRCSDCVEAYRKYHREYQKAYKTISRKRRRRGLLKIKHGTIGGYVNHGCRCALCRKAWRERQNAYMARDPEQREKHRIRTKISMKELRLRKKNESK